VLSPDDPPLPPLPELPPEPSQEHASNAVPSLLQTWVPEPLLHAQTCVVPGVQAGATR